MQNRLLVGVITSTHGVRGEVKIFPTTDDSKRFESLKEVWMDQNGQDVKLKITGVKFFKKYVILKFEGFDAIEQIEKYRGKELYIDRKDAVELKKDEFFIADLIGLNVETTDGINLGKIMQVLQTGANDVYVVGGLAKEYYLPAIADCVKSIDLSQNRMVVFLMKGLEDL